MISLRGTFERQCHSHGKLYLGGNLIEMFCGNTLVVETLLVLNQSPSGRLARFTNLALQLPPQSTKLGGGESFVVLSW